MNLLVPTLALLLLGLVAYVLPDAEAQATDIQYLCRDQNFRCDRIAGTGTYTANEHTGNNANNILFFFRAAVPTGGEKTFTLLNHMDNFEIKTDKQLGLSSDAELNVIYTGPVSETQDRTYTLTIRVENYERSDPRHIDDRFTATVRFNEVNNHVPTITSVGGMNLEDDNSVTIERFLTSVNTSSMITIPIVVDDNDLVHDSVTNSHKQNIVYRISNYMQDGVARDTPANLVEFNDPTFVLTADKPRVITFDFTASDGRTMVVSSVRVDIKNPIQHADIKFFEGEFPLDDAACVGQSGTVDTSNSSQECNHRLNRGGVIERATPATTYHNSILGGNIVFGDAGITGFNKTAITLTPNIIINNDSNTEKFNEFTFDEDNTGITNGIYKFTIPAYEGTHVQYRFDIKSNIIVTDSSSNKKILEPIQNITFVIDRVSPIITHDTFRTGYQGIPLDRDMCIVNATDNVGCDILKSTPTDIFSTSNLRVIDRENPEYAENNNQYVMSNASFATDTVQELNIRYSVSEDSARDMAGNLPAPVTYRFNIVNVNAYTVELLDQRDNPISGLSHNGPIHGRITFEERVAGFNSTNVALTSTILGPPDATAPEFLLGRVSDTTYNFSIYPEQDTHINYQLVITADDVSTVGSTLPVYPYPSTTAFAIDTIAPTFQFNGEDIITNRGIGNIPVSLTDTNTLTASNITIRDRYNEDYTHSPNIRQLGNPNSTHPINTILDSSRVQVNGLLITGSADAAGNSPVAISLRLEIRDDISPVLAQPANPIIIKYGETPTGIIIPLTDNNPAEDRTSITCDGDPQDYSRHEDPAPGLQCTGTDRSGNVGRITVPVQYLQFEFAGQTGGIPQINEGQSREVSLTLTNSPIADVNYTIQLQQDNTARDVDWAKISPAGVITFTPPHSLIGPLEDPKPYSFVVTARLAGNPAISAVTSYNITVQNQNIPFELDQNSILGAAPEIIRKDQSRTIDISSHYTEASESSALRLAVSISQIRQIVSGNPQNVDSDHATRDRFTILDDNKLVLSTVDVDPGRYFVDICTIRYSGDSPSGSCDTSNADHKGVSITVDVLPASGNTQTAINATLTIVESDGSITTHNDTTSRTYHNSSLFGILQFSDDVAGFNQDNIELAPTIQHGDTDGNFTIVGFDTISPRYYTFVIPVHQGVHVDYVMSINNENTGSAGSFSLSEDYEFTADTARPRLGLLIRGVDVIAEGKTEVTIEQKRSNSFSIANITLTDPGDSTYNARVVLDSTIDVSVRGNYSLDISAIDATDDTTNKGADKAGNVPLPYMADITVRDTTPPTFTTQNTDITTKYGQIASFQYRVTDNDKVYAPNQPQTKDCEGMPEIRENPTISCIVTDPSGNSGGVATRNIVFQQFTPTPGAKLTVNEGSSSTANTLGTLTNHPLLPVSYNITRGNASVTWASVYNTEGTLYANFTSIPYDTVQSENTDIILNVTAYLTDYPHIAASADITVEIAKVNRPIALNAGSDLENIRDILGDTDVDILSHYSESIANNDMTLEVAITGIQKYTNNVRASIDNSNPTYAKITIDDNKLRFIGLSSEDAGHYEISVCVRPMVDTDCSGGQQITLQVLVRPEYNEPQIKSGGPGITMSEGDSPLTIQLRDYFTDPYHPDDNVDDLRFSLVPHPDFVTFLKDDTGARYSVKPGFHDQGAYYLEVTATGRGLDSIHGTPDDQRASTLITLNVSNVNQKPVLPLFDDRDGDPNNQGTPIIPLSPGTMYTFNLDGSDIIDNHPCSVTDHIINGRDALTASTDCSSVPRYSSDPDDVRFVFDPDSVDAGNDFVQTGDRIETIQIRFNGQLLPENAYEFEWPILSFMLPDAKLLDVAQFNGTAPILNITIVDSGGLVESQVYAIDIGLHVREVRTVDLTTVNPDQVSNTKISVNNDNRLTNIRNVTVNLESLGAESKYAIIFYHSPPGAAAGTTNGLNPYFHTALTHINGEEIRFLSGAVDINVTSSTCPCVLEFSYTPHFSIPEESLVIYHFDETEQRWEILESKVDTVRKIITATTNTFSIFAPGMDPRERSIGSADDGDRSKKPTFGRSWEVESIQQVRQGFTFNDYTLDITDNWHTDFEKTSSIIGDINRADIKAYSPNGLLSVSLILGIPEIGDTSNAESIIDVKIEPDYTSDAGYRILEVIHTQPEALIDPEMTTADITKSYCSKAHDEKYCHTVSIEFAVNAPLSHDVIALQAVDMQRRSTVTYLNDGIEFTGESLLAPTTATIYVKDSNQDHPKIHDLVQIDRRFPVYEDQFGDSWHVNTFGTWNRLTVPDVSRQADPHSSVMTRHNSNFEQIINHEYNKALKLFDSGSIQGHLDNTHTIHFGGEERIDGDMLNRMKISEQLALDLLESYGK